MIVVEIVETLNIPLHEPPLESSPRPEVFFFRPVRSYIFCLRLRPYPKIRPLWEYGSLDCLKASKPPSEKRHSCEEISLALQLKKMKKLKAGGECLLLWLSFSQVGLPCTQDEVISENLIDVNTWLLDAEGNGGSCRPRTLKCFSISSPYLCWWSKDEMSRVWQKFGLEEELLFYFHTSNLSSNSWGSSNSWESSNSFGSLKSILSFEVIIKFHQPHKTHQSILKRSWKNPANIKRTSGEHLDTSRGHLQNI